MNDFRKYMEDAARTDLSDAQYEAAVNRLVDNPALIRLWHFATGLHTEAGELSDTLKKHIYYGTPLDKLNLFEEAGDIAWYFSGLLRTLEVLLNTDKIEDRVCNANIAKLKARYPEKFNQVEAEARDVERELYLVQQTLDKKEDS